MLRTKENRPEGVRHDRGLLGAVAFEATLVLAGLTGCTTPNRPLRTTTAPFAVTDAGLRDPERRATFAPTSVEQFDDHTIVVVEFDDQGQFWDRRQVDALEAEILRQAGGADDPGGRVPHRQ